MANLVGQLVSMNILVAGEVNLSVPSKPTNQSDFCLGWNEITDYDAELRRVEFFVDDLLAEHPEVKPKNKIIDLLEGRQSDKKLEVP